LFKDWHPDNGIETLIRQINDAAEFAMFVNKPIPEADLVEASEYLILKSGVFKEDYKE